MKKNMSKKEQVIRLILSVISLFIALIIPFYYALIVTGLMFLTGMSGYCPLYNICPFKKTCRLNENEHDL